jgi:hypothetical protein
VAYSYILKVMAAHASETLVPIVQGPAEIPDDFAKQLRVEPFAWGICP